MRHLGLTGQYITRLTVPRRRLLGRVQEVRALGVHKGTQRSVFSNASMNNLHYEQTLGLLRTQRDPYFQMFRSQILTFHE